MTRVGWALQCFLQRHVWAYIHDFFNYYKKYLLFRELVQSHWKLLKETIVAIKFKNFAVYISFVLGFSSITNCVLEFDRTFDQQVNQRPLAPTTHIAPPQSSKPIEKTDLSDAISSHTTEPLANQKKK